MEAFDYSVEICDCDWESVFAVCEECSALPPSSTVVDDSEKTDFENTGSMFTKRLHRVDPAAGFVDADLPIDGPPDCESSPAEHYLSKRGVSGMENVLSGSEEDKHLLAVNMFFEQIRNTPEAERFAEVSPTRAGNTGEAMEPCSDGQQPSILKQRGPPAWGEAGVCKEISDPFGIVSNIEETMKKHQSGSNNSLEVAASESEPMKKNLTRPDTDSQIVEEVCTKATADEATQWRQPRDPPDRVETFTSDTTNTIRTVTRESPPSAPGKRKRRKRRKRGQLSAGHERPASFLVSDLTEKQDSWRQTSALCLSDDDGGDNDGSALATGNCRDLQPFGRLQLQESTILEKRFESQVPVSEDVAVKYELTAETAKCGREDVWRKSLQRSEEMNLSVASCGNEQLCTAAVTSPAHSVSPSSELNSPSVDVSQRDTRSAAKLVLAGEAGNSGNNTLCQREADRQQQLGVVFHCTDQCSSNPDFPSSEDGMRGSGAPNTPFETRPCPFLWIPTLLDGIKTSLDGRLVSESHCSLQLGVTRQQTVHPSRALLVKHAETQSRSVSKDTTDSNSDSDSTTASEAESLTPPALTPSAFTMSSFWSDMEKVTINDILAIRTLNEAPPTPPLQEHEPTDASALMDSGFFIQMDESAPRQTNEDASRTATSEPSSASVPPKETCGSETVYTDDTTSIRDSSPSHHTGGAQTHLRRISKNVTVQNLHALESVHDTWRVQHSQTVKKGQLENVTSGYRSDKDQDVDLYAPSETNRYTTSFTEIFHYLFGGKQSNPSQPATADVTTCYTDGNSVPETYDHFFSEFDIGSFFSLLNTAGKTEDELVFPCPDSANRTLQFPEAYDYFFPSSSSEDSSEESDEDRSHPVRVVSSPDPRSSTSEVSTDIYEDFFTENDLKQNFFWKNTFSFRKISFSGYAVQQSQSALTVRWSSRSFQRRLHPINAQGNPDVFFSSPLHSSFENRISTQLAQWSRFEKVKMAISNPGLDAPLLCLRQSDMCLLCIAFASWVLKTANPQVGDAWKAVLLANISALSAIQCLRKYIMIEAVPGETKEITFQHSDS